VALPAIEITISSPSSAVAVAASAAVAAPAAPVETRRNAYYPRAGVVLECLLEDFGDGSGSETATIEAVPRSVEVRRNDHRTADTFRVELDFRTLPLDPRTMRSIRVHVLLGDVGDAEGALAIDDDRYRAFLGYVDVPETQLSALGETVTLEGRDYTGLFLDAKWSGKAIDVTGPLEGVVRGILETVPGADGIAVVFANASAATVLSGVIGRKKFAPHPGDDTWTVLCDLCGRAGLVPVVVLDEIWILDSVAIQAGKTARFAYGENLSKLTFKRNITEVRTRQIEVRCWDEQARETRTAKYPTSAIVKKKTVSPKGKVTETTAPIYPFYVSGTYTSAQLAALAKTIHDEAARQQIEGDLETMEMVDLDNTVRVPLIGNGDRVVVQLGTALSESIAGMSPAEAVLWLSSGPEALDVVTATGIVNGFTKAQGLSTAFYVKEAAHRWAWDAGYTCNIRFINYVGGQAT
jgi:hypothetical protein